MKLAHVKTVLGIPAGVPLDLSRQLDQDQKPTPWLRYWDNVRRIAFVIHEETLAKIKAEPEMATLALKSEKRISKDTHEADTGALIPGSEYTNHILIISDSISDSL